MLFLLLCSFITVCL